MAVAVDHLLQGHQQAVAVFDMLIMFLLHQVMLLLLLLVLVVRVVYQMQVLVLVVQ
jgi:hypothetical protein